MDIYDILKMRASFETYKENWAAKLMSYVLGDYTESTVLLFTSLAIDDKLNPSKAHMSASKHIFKYLNDHL